MKKLVLLSISCFTVFQLSAQNLQYLDQSNNNLSATSITISGTVSDFSLEDYVKIRNNGASNIDVKVKRYELSAVTGTKNYFCWTLCYSPMNAGANFQFPIPTDNAWDDYVTVNAGAISAYQLIVYYQPYSNTGSSTYRYVAFDGNNPNDSTYIDIVFDVTLGVNEINKTTNFTLFPNPANEQVNINFEVANVSSSRTIIVYDVLGNKVAEYALGGNTGRIAADVSNLNNGFYFFSLIENNKAILTKKLMVNH